MSDEPRDQNPEEAIFERRRFMRIDGNFVVSYSDISTAQSKIDVSQTKNLSLGGILFTTDKKIDPGTVLRIKLRIPDYPDYINIKVSVIDSKERIKDILYETRGKFIAIKDKDKEAISKLVEYYLKHKKQ